MHLFAWIESMTAMEPTLRPTAKVLVDHISLVQSKETCYIRPCCFDESHSDTTSWQGTDHDDDDTFDITNTPGDRTAMTSMDISCLVPETMKTQFTKKHAIHEELPVPQALLDKSDDELQRTGPSIEEWIGTVGCRNSSESALGSHKASSSISVTSPPSNSLPPGGIEQGSLLLTPAPTAQETQPDTEFLVTGIMAILEDSSARDSARSEELEKAFHASHEKLESCLLRLKKEDSDWRSRLSKLIEESFTDTKGFSLLIIASKFRNEVLAREVVEEVVRKNCKLINDTTIFGNSALHYAAFHGRPKMIKFLLDNGADPSTQNIRGRTALYIALRYDRRDAIEELYVHLSPEQVNARDDHGRTLLHAATNSSSNKIIDRLVASGANTEISDLFGDTALRVAQRARNQDHIDAIRAHMSRNPDKNERPPDRNDRGRYDPVINRDIVACFCEVCLVRKAVSNAIGHPSKASDTCVCPNHLRSFCRDSISFERGIDAILSFCPCSGCVSGREHNIGNPPCGIPMSSCSLSYGEGLHSAPAIHPPFTEPPTLPSDSDFIDKPIPPYPGHRYYDHLIKKELGTNSSNISPQSMITISLKSLADAGFTGKRSYRKKPQEALEWALTSFLNGFVDAKQAKATVDILLEHGAQIDTIVHVRNSKWTLLSVAARNQYLSLMRLLIDKKADLNFQTVACATPLAAAIRSDKALSVRMLLEAGAKVNTQTLEDEKIHVKGKSCLDRILLRRKSTLLHECVLKYDQLGWHIPLLLAHGALTDLADSDGCTPLHIAVKDSRLHAVMVLLESGANVNLLNNARASPLAIAIESCDIDIVSALLLYGANVNTPSNGHPCALLHALSTSSSEIAALILLEYTRDEKVHRTSSNGLGALHCLPASSKPNMHLLIDLLLARGCKIDAETQTGNTPLHIAAYMGKATIVKKLVECGAIAHAQNHHGQTPLHLAQGRHREVVECLGGTFKKSLKETIRKQAETIREQTRPYF
jgi:ankyrin repeat protein